MKVICAITERNESILRLEQSFKSIGVDVRIFISEDFRENCSYLHKKLDKLGCKFFRKEYNRQKRLELYNLIQKFSPDKILFVNFPHDIYPISYIDELKQHLSVIFWFVDVLPQKKFFEDYFHNAKVFVYEKKDADELKNKYPNLRVKYLPVGYSDAYADGGVSVASSHGLIDIAFIGTPYKNRLLLLDYLAKNALREGWNLKIIGPFYQANHFWKKFIFKHRYPELFPFIINKSISSFEAAKIYRTSKICLNIHLEKNHSLNPRTFEIMASGAFELIDRRDDYHGFLTPNEDLVDFSTPDEMIDKIRYFLTHDEERNAIANAGQQKVCPTFSMKELIHAILS